MDWVAFFPGQGSQAVGMGVALAAAHPTAARTWAEADAALGGGLTDLARTGPDDALTRTDNAQPAILTCSVAAWRVLRERADLPDPIAFAGHSLGEWSALVAAGSLALADAVRLVRARGRFMQEAVAEGAGAMSAILGLEAREVAAACDEAAEVGVVSPANLNGGGQVVIAGATAAVAQAEALLQARGAKRVVRLQVSAPFHCALMAPAAERLRPLLQDTRFDPPTAPVFTNVEAAPNSAPGRMPELLAAQVVSPVRWEETVRAIARAGADRGVELGHGKVLAGLVRRIGPGLPVSPCGEPADLAAFESWH